MTGSAADITRHYVACTYGQMHLYLAGDRDSDNIPLVCFHMSPYSGRYYQYFQSEMARDRLVICPDTPGYGQSSAPEEPATINDLANAMAEMLTEMSLDQVDVLGFHTGTFIAAEVARIVPEKIRSLILPGIPLVPWERRAGLIDQYAKPRPYFDEPDFLASKWRDGLNANPQGWTGMRYLDMFSDVLLSGERSNWGFQAVFAYQPEEMLPEITQPVFIPLADESLLENSRTAADLFKNVTTKECAELKGDMFENNPEKLAGYIRAFWQDLEN